MDNEQEVYMDKIEMGSYYTALKSDVSAFESRDACHLVYEKHNTFNKVGCEKDLNGIMKEGIRESISIILMNLFRTYYAFAEDPARRDPETIRRYIQEPLLNNLCIF